MTSVVFIPTCLYFEIHGYNLWSTFVADVAHRFLVCYLVSFCLFCYHLFSVDFETLKNCVVTSTSS